MTKLDKWLSSMTEGIPFSSMRKKVSSKRTKRRTRKKKKNNKRTKKRSGRLGSAVAGSRRKRTTKSIPPKGVIIRKGSKLYRSDGTKMELFTQ